MHPKNPCKVSVFFLRTIIYKEILSLKLYFYKVFIYCSKDYMLLA